MTAGNPVASETAAYLDLGPIARTEGVVALPGSKSISNRTLLLAALATGTTVVEDLLDADDVDRMRDALSQLGVHVEQRASSRDFLVHGTGGAIPAPVARLFLGNAGTAFRPLTAVLALTGGAYELSGVARMQSGGAKAEFRLGGTWHYDARKKAFDRIEFAAVGPFDNKLLQDHYREKMGEDVSLLGIGFELAEPGSLGYGTPPAPFYYDPTGVDYFGTGSRR